jgi:hypothetical protein
MSESVSHLELVKRIICHIRSHFSGPFYVVTLHDLPGAIGGEKPPKIGSFRPDVYAIDAPLSRTIVGEAKTQGDLETDHSRKQLKAFLGFLRLQTNAVFVLAVPWQAVAQGRALLKSIQEELGASAVEIVVIDNIQGDE